MSSERAALIRRWHEESHDALRAMLPADVMFMGLRLHITENVMPLDDSTEGDPYHQAVEREARPGRRVLDMGTGSGVSALLAARAGGDVIAVDINPEAVACARANAEGNDLAERITFVHGDLFQGVEGDFDLIIFDPPFRWFEPRDLLERSHTDADYRTLTAFMTEAAGRLQAEGRIVMNFGTSGDLDYLLELIERLTSFPSGRATARRRSSGTRPSTTCSGCSSHECAVAVRPPSPALPLLPCPPGRERHPERICGRAPRSQAGQERTTIGTEPGAVPDRHRLR